MHGTVLVALRIRVPWSIGWTHSKVNQSINQSINRTGWPAQNGDHLENGSSHQARGLIMGVGSCAMQNSVTSASPARGKDEYMKAKLLVVTRQFCFFFSFQWHTTKNSPPFLGERGTPLPQTPSPKRGSALLGQGEGGWKMSNLIRDFWCCCIA
jgi:hypothetical protein